MGFENQEGLGSKPGLAAWVLGDLGQGAPPAPSLVSSSVKWYC